MHFFHFSLLITAVSQTSMVASQPLDVAPPLEDGVAPPPPPDPTGIVQKIETDFQSHPELNGVVIGKGLYSCNHYMKLFDKAREGCLLVGCDVNKKVCDAHACVTIDGTTNQGVVGQFKGYLDDLRTVIAGSCKENHSNESYCTPSGTCSNNNRVKVQIPSFIGSSTAKYGVIFVANYKVTFSEKQKKSSCDIIKDLFNAGLGTLPGGSLFGATSILCEDN
ncbi:hypothetical protein FIE12Z_1806 [Fusarium flagelliforme]|uniref:Secreted protein n=2 Tax=Fusarium flagelliforme TaxID=2675880 RepID=A0A395N179_9HYPO|nr:hypothetical protein FIE12Z_1806 [Fusarium flagelliforme]